MQWFKRHVKAETSAISRWLSGTMPRRLKNLMIDEVSSVDRGAGRGVKIILMKRDDSGDLPEIEKMVGALRADLDAIRKDDQITDKDAAIADRIAKFNAAITGSTENDDMDPKQLAEAITKAVGTALTPVLERLGNIERENVVLKMSAKQKAFYDAMDGEDKKKAFAEMDDEAREKCMDSAKKSLETDPVVKSLQSTVEKQDAVIADLKKRLGVHDENATVESFKKQAKELGLPEAHGEIMRKAYAGDAEAIKKHNELLKGLTEQVRTGKVFDEFGDGSGRSVTGAMAQLEAKAAELRKTETKLTREQAFDKVYTDPANADLVQQSKKEHFAKIGA